MKFALQLVLLYSLFLSNLTAISIAPDEQLPKPCVSNTKGRSQFSFVEKHKVMNTYRLLVIEKGKFDTYNSNMISDKQAVKACAIASQIISSNDFQDELATLNFMSRNRCLSCSGGINPRPESIPGAEVLDSLFRSAKVTMNFVVSKGRCRGALGATCPNSTQIMSNYSAIACNMPDLPIEYAYAVHLCHEFSHTVGYCHTDHKDDVAEKVGWIAYYIAVKMHQGK